MSKLIHSEKPAAQPKTGGQKQIAGRFKELREKGNILRNSRVYLSGPMDFVASREEEKEFGWRNRVSQFLMEKFDTAIYDPWNKPGVEGLQDYGKEDEFSTRKRQEWTYDESMDGDRKRAELCDEFWPTLHIDLRMTDTSDFLIAYCPTNIYSVGTVHEIATARLQNKPVLFVTPPVTFPTYDKLRERLEKNGDKESLHLLNQLREEAPLRDNPKAIPSMWYMALIDSHYFFDGFGFADYAKEFGWREGALDLHEKEFPPQRPLLSYLEKLNDAIPPKYDLGREVYVDNVDWLVFEQPDKPES